MVTTIIYGTELKRTNKTPLYQSFTNFYNQLFRHFTIPYVKPEYRDSIYIDGGSFDTRVH